LTVPAAISIFGISYTGSYEVNVLRSAERGETISTSKIFSNANKYEMI